MPTVSFAKTLEQIGTQGREAIINRPMHAVSSVDDDGAKCISCMTTTHQRSSGAHSIRFIADVMCLKKSDPGKGREPRNIPFDNCPAAAAPPQWDPHPPVT
ncbi:hypothetical protein ACLOJK_021293 [Asimina triloba]